MIAPIPVARPSAGDREILTSLNALVRRENVRQPLDVRLYGAVGDGSTDDTTALQAAIDATPAGGTLVVPDGYNFFCAGNLTRDGIAIRISGSGLGSKITFGPSAGLVVNGTTATESFCLENLMIQSSGASNRLVTLARINSQGFIRNVYFQGGGNQLFFDRQVYNLLTIGCTFYAASATAVSLVPSAASTLNANSFENCFFVGNKRHVELAGQCIAVGFTRCVFQRNSAITGVQSGVYIHDGVWSTHFNGCAFEDVNAAACVELGRTNYPAFKSGYFSMNAANVVAVDCSGSDGNATGLCMEDFTLSTNNSNNPLINLRSYGLRPTLRGLIFAAGTCAKGVAGTVPDRDVRQDINFQGTFTAKSDYLRDPHLLTAWWSGTGAAPPVAAGAFNMTVTRQSLGNYFAAFTTPMDHTKYAVTMSVRVAALAASIRQLTQSVSGFSFDVIDASAAYQDAAGIQIHVAGGLD